MDYQDEIQRLRNEYEETFQTLKANAPLKNASYYAALKDERRLTKKITALQRKHHLLAKDPCAGQPCHKCIYRTRKDVRSKCDVKKNMAANNGLFTGFYPTGEFSEWKNGKRKTVGRYYRKHSKGHEASGRSS